MIDVVKFIETRKINGIFTEMTNTELIKKIGNSNLGTKHYFDCEQPENGYSYFYKNIELMMIDNLVYCISLDPSVLNLTFKNTVKIHKNTSLDFFLRMLETHHINWSFYQNECFDKQLTIVTENKTLISFTFFDNETNISRIQQYAKSYTLYS